MHIFASDLPLKANYLKADDIDFAAWNLAGHDHREEFRNSGNLPARTAWLRAERLQGLKDALATGELLALGIAEGDPDLEISLIPENVFLSPRSRLDSESSQVAGLAVTFLEVRICRASPGSSRVSVNSSSIGRPNHLAITLEAWNALKAEFPGFLELDKSSQNREIRELAARLHPRKFPGQSRIGDSTIRRHRRDNSDLFT